MRIALVCDYSLDYLGGAQTAFLAEAAALAEGGHSVVVVSPSHRASPAGGALFERIRARATIPGLGLPLIRNTGRLRDDLRALFEGHAIDVVHVHSEFGLVAAAIDVADSLELPVVHTVHTFFWQTHLPRAAQAVAAGAIRGFQRFITGHPALVAQPARARADAAMCAMTLATAHRARVVVSPSRHQRDRLVAAGLDHVVALPNTIVTTGRKRGEPPLAVGAPLRLVWIGRCVREKRLAEFLAACRAALSALPPGALEVEIVGDGPLLAAARSATTGTPQIVFSGRVDGAGVVRALQRAHLVALTSSGFDNQPMTVIEAVYAARGVLYVDPALTEGLDRAGVLCASDSVADMTATIVRLAENPHLVVEAGKRAAPAFDVFSPAAHERLLDAVYRGQLVSLAS